MRLEKDIGGIERKDRREERWYRLRGSGVRGQRLQVKDKLIDRQLRKI